MGKNHWLIFVALIGLSQTMALAQTSTDDAPLQEEMLVLGTKMLTPAERTTTNTVVITAEQIETYQWKTLADVLHGLPGISLVRNGAEGGLTTAFVRGAKSENTLVLLDGMRINDPSGVGRGYDFSNLSTAGIDRLELMLGPQTALYGTDASSGVINIVTHRGGGQNHVDLEVSDESTQRLNARFGGANGAFDWSVSGGYAKSDYLSAQGVGNSLEDDRFENINLHLRLNYRFENGAETSLNVSQLQGESDIDAFDGDDPNYTNDLDQTVLAWQVRKNLWEDRWETSFHVGYSDVSRTSIDSVDEAHPASALDARFDGEATSLEWRNRLLVTENVTLLTGAAFEREEADSFSLSSSSFGDFETTSMGEADTAGVYLHGSYLTERGLSFYGGLRYDDHDRFGGEATYRAGFDYLADNAGLRIRGSYGTGFKAPSLFQLTSNFGNEDLDAETSESTEIALIKDLADGKGHVGVTWYQNEYEQLIEFFFDPVTFSSFYFNLDRAEADGIEFFADWTGENWGARLSYDTQDAENTSDPANAIPLIRRFDDKANLRFHWQATQALRLHGEILRYGESLDTDFNTFPSQDVTLDAYTLVHIGAAYTFAEQWTLRLRAENLTDEDYVQVLGFNTPGRRIFAGARISF